MPRESVVDRNALIKLLCEPLTETERASQLGIARSSYYAQLAKLTKEGVLVNTLPDDMKLTAAHPRSIRSSTHHAPVLHIKWRNELGIWGVQSSLLDEWDDSSFRSADISVVARWLSNQKFESKTSFVITPRVPKTSTYYGNEIKLRWSVKDTMCSIPSGWKLCLTQETIERLTIAIARVVDAEAIILPEGLLDDAS